jgi:predicted ribosome quality control (RQC) complex YloA/Tae2 family protein
MLSNYYTLRYIVSTLDSTLKGRRIREVFSQRRDELAVAFEETGEHLIIQCRRDASTLYRDDRIARARRNTADLLEETVGATVTGVTVPGPDRVALIGLDTGLRIAVLCFGASANVCVLAASGEVLSTFKSGPRLRGTHLEIAEGEPLFDLLAFRAAAAAPGPATAGPFIRKLFPVLGGTLTQEILERAGISSSRPVAGLDEAALSATEGALRSVLTDLGRPRAILYMDGDGAPQLFSLIPLRQAEGLTERRYDDVHRAVREFIARRDASAGVLKEKNSLLSALRARIDRARRTAEAMDADARAAARVAEYERFAGVLMAHPGASVKGARSVTLEADGDTLTIPLEPSLSTVQNSQKYFEKAKKARAAVRQSGERRGRMDRFIERGTTLLEAATRCATREDVKGFMAEHGSELEEFGIGRKSEARKELPFRIFVVEGGFEVWAGKSSANNDLLTLRYAKPDDLWFHARGASGSHVVLKTGSGKGEPGKKAREQAAGIAANYSKMKNSGMVPIAMTQRRYVRKPKGAPPGTVVIEREKVIFAKPALPAAEPETVS